MHGFSLPAWLPGGAADVSGLALVALTSYYRADPNPDTAAAIEHLADGLAASVLGDSATYPFGMIPVTGNAPGYWHAWGSHMIHGLADAGAALDRPEWIEAARASADSFLMRQRGERIREIGVCRRLGQIAYGTNMLVQDLVAIYRATSDSNTRRSPDWRVVVLRQQHRELRDVRRRTGRGDGINGTTVARQHNAGAESTIESAAGAPDGRGGAARRARHAGAEVSVRPIVWLGLSGRPAGGKRISLAPWTGDAYFSGAATTAWGR